MRWLRVKPGQRVQIERQGKLVTKVGGEWFQTGKMQARDFIARGLAEIPRDDLRDEVCGLDKCAIVISGVSEFATELLGELGKKVDVVISDPQLPSEFNFLLDMSMASLPVGNGIEAGLARIMSFEDNVADPWEVAAELYTDDMIAADYGSDDERELTAEVIGDLRVPVYNSGLLWVRKTEATKRMIELWNNDDGERNHALLRAIYRALPMVLTLPSGWSQRFGWEV